MFLMFICLKYLVDGQQDRRTEEEMERGMEGGWTERERDRERGTYRRLDIL